KATETASVSGIGSTTVNATPVTAQIYRVAPLTVTVTTADVDGSRPTAAPNSTIIGIDSLVKYTIQIANTGPNTAYMDHFAFASPWLASMFKLAAAADAPFATSDDSCNADGTGCTKVKAIGPSQTITYSFTGHFPEYLGAALNISVNS